MTRALRILMVSDVSPVAILGGGERVLREQASRLQSLGHDVRVLSRSPAAALDATVERDGVRIRHFPVDRRSPLRFFLSSIREARRAVAEELARGDADLLHVHQPLSGYGALRSPAAARIPSLYTFHSPAALEYGLRRGPTGGLRDRLAARMAMEALWHIEGSCLRRATRIHVLSDFSATLLGDLYRIPASRIVRIPGGADCDRFRPAADPSAVREALGLPAGRPVLFTLRNLEPRMGLDILLRAVAILCRRVPEVLLLIGGAGPLRPELEALTASLKLDGHVRFLGYVAEERLLPYYQAADLFVLPTRKLEGFGLVTVEALACGTPVLGTSVGATPEILGPLDPDLVFRGRRPEVMAQDLERILDRLSRDPVGARGLREACRRHAETHYSWNDSVARLEAAFRELRDQRDAAATERSHTPESGRDGLPGGFGPVSSRDVDQPGSSGRRTRRDVLTVRRGINPAKRRDPLSGIKLTKRRDPLSGIKRKKRRIKRGLGIPRLRQRTWLLILIAFLGALYLGARVADFTTKLGQYAPQGYEPKDFARQQFLEFLEGKTGEKP